MSSVDGSQSAAATINADPGTVAHVLSTERRQHVIDALGEVAPITLKELANEIAELEFGPGYSSDERKAVYIGLYQNDFEPLKAAGVWTDLEGRKHLIARGENFEGFVTVLDSLRSLTEGGR